MRIIETMSQSNSEQLPNDLDQLAERLQEIQDSICQLQNVYCFCYLKDGRQITHVTASDEERNFLKRAFPQDHIESLLADFTDSNVENVITEYLDCEYLSLQGIAIRGEQDHLLGVWILMAVLKDRLPMPTEVPEQVLRRPAAGMDQIIRMIDSMTRLYISERMKSGDLRRDLSQLEITDKAIKASLKRNEVMTEMLKSLESEEEFPIVATEILEQTGNYLNLDNCALIRLSPDGRTCDIQAEWVRMREFAINRSLKDIPVKDLPFFTGRPFTISSNAMIPDDFSACFQRFGISAGVFLPVMIREQVGMYLSFTIMTDQHTWEVDEIKFLNDVKKIIQSVLARKMTKTSLSNSYKTIEQILEKSGCGIIVLDCERQQELYANEVFKEMIYEEADRYDLDMLLYREISQDELEKVEFAATREKRYFEVSYGSLKWIDDKDVRICTIYDVTDRKNYQHRIERQANVDFLTGLLNRKRLEMDFIAQIHACQATNRTCALVCIDLDDFKVINDGLGTEIGDELLRTVAAGIERIAGIRINTYRIGSDEFAMLVPDDKMDDLEHILDKLRQMFSTAWTIGDSEYYCTMSAGIAQYPKDGEDAAELHRRADFALREAKNLGKGRIEYYSNEVSDTSIKRIDMERELRKAVEEGCSEFEVYYQPKVDFAKEGHPCCGAEALVRWNSSAFGFVMPLDFVPLAEYLGLIVPIGKHILKTAAARCKYWNDFGHPEYNVNVNLSVVQLMQEDIVDVVKEVLEETEINPQSLTLEVTESLAASDIENIGKKLKALRDMGVRVALDDFGTGYSSLSYIRDLPLDSIKIDKSFIDHVGDDNYSDVFVETVTKLAESIDLDVVVEGVENAKQVSALTGMDVTEMQGYLYDKPLSQADFEKKYLG